MKHVGGMGLGVFTIGVLACGVNAPLDTGPAPQTILSRPGCGSIDLAVGGDTLYWAEKGTGLVAQMPTSGGPITPIATGESAPSFLTIEGANVYWSVSTGVRWSAEGTKPATFADSPGEIRGLAVSGGKVYYSEGTRVVLMIFERSLPLHAAVEQMSGVPTALAIDGNTLVYPTDVNGDVEVVTLGSQGVTGLCAGEDASGNPLGRDCRRVARSQRALFFGKIIAQPGRVLWADGGTLKMAPTTTTAGPGPVANDTVAFTVDRPISGMAANESTAYFSESGALAAIYRTPIAADQTAIRIARGQNEPRSVAVDGKRVYWSTADCAIMATGL